MKLTIKQKIAGILAGAVMILIFTNPSIEDFSAFSGFNKISDPRLVMKRDKNYFILSKYSYQVFLDEKHLKRKYVAIFGNFYELGDLEVVTK